MKNSVTFLCSLILIGCQSPKYVQDFSVGSMREVTVGSSMIQWGEQDLFSGLRFVLVYAGIDHDVIQVTYREFYIDNGDAYARPAYAQELKYDLTKSRLISFRDIRMQIDTADQQRVRFKVIKAPGTGLIGVWISEDHKVTGFTSGSAARKAGVEEGDEILKVDAEDVKMLSVSGVAGRLRGDPGSLVRLTIRRDDQELTIDIVRK